MRSLSCSSACLNVPNQMENQIQKRSGNAADSTSAGADDTGGGFEVGTRERFTGGGTTTLVGGLQKKKGSEVGGGLPSKTSSGEFVWLSF